MESDGECRRGGLLLFVHGLTRRSGFGAPTGHVEEKKDGEVALAAKAVEVDGLVRCRSRHHLDPRFDCRIDVDVVALDLAMAAGETDAQASQRSTESAGVGQTQRGVVRLRPRLP